MGHNSNLTRYQLEIIGTFEIIGQFNIGVNEEYLVWRISLDLCENLRHWISGYTGISVGMNNLFDYSIRE